MSRIYDLIEKHCADGVRSVALGKLLNCVPSTPYTVKSSKYHDSLPTPVLTTGKRFILGYTDETNGVYKASKGKPVILFDKSTNSFYWVDYEFKIRNPEIVILAPKKGVNLKYVYYAIKNIQYVSWRPVRRSISEYLNFKIPLPHSRVQKEIVNILNIFKNLIAELKAERDMRIRQYAHYRSCLFSFDGIDKNVKRDSVKWCEISKTGTLIQGERLKKSYFKKSGVGCIPHDQLEQYGAHTNQTNTFIPEALATEFKKAKKGDLVVVARGESREDICKAVAWLGHEEIIVDDYTYIYRHSLNPKYVSYFFMTHQFEKQMKPCIRGVKFPSISIDKMGRIKIPIPPSEEQDRIVNILDKFDAFVNGSSSGLVAEIHARQKQYEYYRNRLLTFLKGI